MTEKLKDMPTNILSSFNLEKPLEKRPKLVLMLEHSLLNYLATQFKIENRSIITVSTR